MEDVPLLHISNSTLSCCSTSPQKEVSSTIGASGVRQGLSFPIIPIRDAEGEVVPFFPNPAI